MSEQVRVDRAAIHREIDAARQTFRALLAGATADDLRRRSNGTRWTNEQLLFHMLFGYLIVRALLPLVRTCARLPPRASRLFARCLDAGTGPFDVINYLGSCAGALVFNRDRMAGELDRVAIGLLRRLDAEADAGLLQGMSFPSGWDPYFRDWMSVADVYHYATLHFEAHRHQLTLDEHTQ